MDGPEFRGLAAQQGLPLRYLGPGDYRAELARVREEHERLWPAHPWKE